MKKLTKAQVEARWRHMDALKASSETVEEAIDQYNQTMQEAWEKIEEAVSSYNEAIAQASEFKEEVYSEAQEWQESDKGQSYQEWIDEWEADLDEIEVEQPDELEVPDMEASDSLENLPDEPDM
jgi:uncharacterized coiled-coil DUF342 family protein